MNSPRPMEGAIANPRDALASRGASAWDMTLPVAAGVFLGALLFGLFALAYLHAQTRSVSFAGVSAASSTTSSLQRSGEQLVANEDDTAAALPRLPGLIEANRRRLRTACIAGTIGHRRSNGWVQAVADSAPRRCVATSQ